MIRLGKKVELLEWGLGTTTVNQNWNTIGKGTLLNKPKIKAGLTEVAVALDGAFKKANEKDDSIKLCQPGEGMTPASDKWGEVAVGRLKAVDQEGGKTIVRIEIKGAIKIGKGM